jgi:hypothetical protein
LSCSCVTVWPSSTWFCLKAAAYTSVAFSFICSWCCSARNATYIKLLCLKSVTAVKLLSSGVNSAYVAVEIGISFASKCCYSVVMAVAFFDICCSTFSNSIYSPYDRARHYYIIFCGLAAHSDNIFVCWESNTLLYSSDDSSSSFYSSGRSSKKALRVGLHFNWILGRTNYCCRELHCCYRILQWISE